MQDITSDGVDFDTNYIYGTAPLNENLLINIGKKWGHEIFRFPTTPSGRCQVIVPEGVITKDTSISITDTGVGYPSNRLPTH